MTTIGCVAVGDINKWTGVMSYFDGHITGLGFNVWNEWKRNPDLPNSLLRYDDWTTYTNGGVCMYCGKIANKACEIKPELKWHGEDKDVLYHTHRTGQPEQYHISDNSIEKALLFYGNAIKWIYILEQQKETIHIAILQSKVYKEYRVGKVNTGKVITYKNDYKHLTTLDKNSDIFLGKKRLEEIRKVIG
jgi:hypothetical protein